MEYLWPLGLILGLQGFWIKGSGHYDDDQNCGFGHVYHHQCNNVCFTLALLTKMVMMRTKMSTMMCWLFGCC